ncbi:MAG TPA: hypothetical protein DDZ67_15235 [Xanthomonadaceae bacterium]|nr:hypothetical protein [Xanthomonadaceae bacterium]
MARFLLLLVACSLLLGACRREPPEQRLRARVEAMRDALQQRKPADFMAAVAADFVGNDGLDRAALQRMLQLQVLGNASIGATLGPMEVQMHGDRATVAFDALLTGAGAGRLLPERAQAYRVVSGWREEDGEWRLYRAEWSGVSER